MRFVVGKEDEHEEHDEHNEHDTQIEGKHTHTHTHTRYTPVVLVGPILQLNRITRKILQE
jgi:ABC-type Zn2+ transport system substrate-binding protein/surface adhesin